MAKNKTRTITMRCLYATPTRIVEQGATAQLDADTAAALVASKQAVYADKAPTPAPTPAPSAELETPSRSASKRDWVAHAVREGLDESDADAMTRDQLAGMFLGEDDQA